MWFIGTGQSGIVTEQTAKRVIGIEIPVPRETLVENELQPVVAAHGSYRFCVSKSLQRLEVEATARVTNNISLAARRVDYSCVLNCFINVLVGITNAKNVVSV